MSDAAHRKAVSRRPAAEQPLTIMQQRFCSEYLKDGNGHQAAIRAGYQPANARCTASRLLARRNVAQHLAELRAEVESRAVADVRELAETLTTIVRARMCDVVDAMGVIRSEQALAHPALSKYLVESSGPEGAGTTKARVELADKLGAIDRLAKLMNYYPAKETREDKRVVKEIRFVAADVKGTET